jgi:predicted ATP-dependent protease
MIPTTNVPTLMLDEEVVQAVRDGKFSIWQVETIDQGIELLTGVPAGVRDKDGRYPEGTVHRRVEDRLRHFAETAQSYSVSQDGTAAQAAGTAATKP